MNGFEKQGLDASAFGESKDSGVFRSFDAFPKTKPTYTRRTTGGGYATVLLVAISAILAFGELRRWHTGSERQEFSVEKGVSHTLQINLDAVISMRCADLHVNVQDASGDRILAGEMLDKDDTNWEMWVKPSSHIHHSSNKKDRVSREEAEREDTHVGHVLGEVRRGSRKFPKTPKMKSAMIVDACRIYGSLEGNKVQGDFHITARGHGYQEWGAEHLDHTSFNFSHLISELSFGPLYPSLLNPLDRTVARTDNHFNRFQYYLSIVPTFYTRSTASLLSRKPMDPDKPFKPTKDTIFTNQYAVTSQSRPVPDNVIPGIFFKFDIEPILLTISESRGGLLALLVRLINMVSGVLVAGGWMYQLWGWGRENIQSEGRRRARSAVGEGMLHGRKEEADEGHLSD